MTSLWTSRLSTDELAQRTAKLVRDGHLEGERSVFVHDLDRMEERIGALHDAFPDNALHGLAVKANPVLAVLRAAVEAGAGLECASIEEVELSLAAGCAPDRIIFDSPAKTMEELSDALSRGLHLNLDNFDELRRVARWVDENGVPGGHVGIRVNPQVGTGSISMTSVAGRVSKFGVPLATRRAELLDAFETYPWLDGLHVHVGSQGCEMEQLVSAVRTIFDLRDEANGRRDIPVTQVDIGGGLPARYTDDFEPPELLDYVEQLRAAVPEAFEDDVRLLTEFGRSIQATCGWAISRVEYVKREGDTTMAVIHLGADGLMRPVYAPDDWYHDYLVLDGDGALSDNGEVPITVVGPLCFGGDILTRDRKLPEPREGDLVVVRDVGAYTLSMWSRHCSRGLPTVLGWRDSGATVLKEREDPQDVVAFWS